MRTLTTVQIPKRYKDQLIPRRAFSLEESHENATSLKWIETVFKSKKASNGYIVTIAAITTTNGASIFAASACSPDDIYLFSRQKAAALALGRARQQAFRYLAGLPLKSALVNSADAAVTIPDTRMASYAIDLCKDVAYVAEVVSVRKSLINMRCKHKGINIGYVLQCINDSESN